MGEHAISSVVIAAAAIDSGRIVKVYARVVEGEDITPRQLEDKLRREFSPPWGREISN